MKVLNDKGESVTAYTPSGTYYLDEQKAVDLTMENTILKQRCSAHANPYTCKLCSFTCSYRKKWSVPNRD